jgi:hypothetical protein
MLKVDGQWRKTPPGVMAPDSRFPQWKPPALIAFSQALEMTTS